MLASSDDNTLAKWIYLYIFNIIHNVKLQSKCQPNLIIYHEGIIFLFNNWEIDILELNVSIRAYITRFYWYRFSVSHMNYISFSYWLVFEPHGFSIKVYKEMFSLTFKGNVMIL